MIIASLVCLACLGAAALLWLQRDRMSLRLQVTCLALFTSLASIAAVGLLAYRASSDALVEQRAEGLVGIFQARGDRVEDYFETVRRQVQTFGADLLVSEATRDFSASFEKVVAQAPAGYGAPGGPAARAMSRYFDSAFRSGLEANAKPYRGSNAYLATSEAGRVLQAWYIAENPNPVGSKSSLAAAPADADYNKDHARYHPSIRNYLESFGYYDIFLFNTEGDLVYSVFKETDYATNLLSGPYAASNFGEVVREALHSGRPGEVVLRDYKPYEPSYGAPAAFLGTPVFLDGEKVGAAVFQIPVEKINAVVLNDEVLGEAGMAYFAGKDKLMRSAARDESLADALLSVSVDTEAFRLASEGRTGHVAAAGLLGEQTLTAFGPLDIEGLDWELFVEVPMVEVLAPSRALAWSIFVAAALLCVPVVLYALFMARAVVRPVQKMTAAMKDMAEGEADLTHRVDQSLGNEIGEMSRWFNTFVGRIHDLVAEAASVSRDVEAAAVSIESNLGSMSGGLEEQRGQTTQISSRVQDLTRSVDEVASRASEVSRSAARAGDQAEGGRGVVSRTVETIESIAQVVGESAAAVDGLRARAEEIGKVIDVINDIADQTNLLALNAAIEAARAGEHGRGFAVVADEVRKLAERTTHATEEVSASIRSIQEQTGGAVERMGRGRDQVGESVACATQAGSALTEIVEGSRQVAELIRGMAAATEQQSRAAEQITGNIQGIAGVTQRSADGAVEVVASAHELRQKSESLTRLMSAFTVAEAPAADAPDTAPAPAAAAAAGDAPAQRTAA